MNGSRDAGDTYKSTPTPPFSLETQHDVWLSWSSLAQTLPPTTLACCHPTGSRALRHAWEETGSMRESTDPGMGHVMAALSVRPVRRETVLTALVTCVQHNTDHRLANPERTM
eukprot:630287-Rhodomonas_salina.4